MHFANRLHVFTKLVAACLDQVRMHGLLSLHSCHATVMPPLCHHCATDTLPLLPQVQLAAIWDLFTSQCDRHAENVFVDQNGSLQIIDNDKAMGVVSVRNAPTACTRLLQCFGSMTPDGHLGEISLSHQY